MMTLASCNSPKAAKAFRRPSLLVRKERFPTYNFVTGPVERLACVIRRLVATTEAALLLLPDLLVLALVDDLIEEDATFGSGRRRCCC